MDNALKASWNETKAFNSSDDGELRCVCTEKPFYIRTMGLPNINGRRSGCYNNSVIQIEVMNVDGKPDIFRKTLKTKVYLKVWLPNIQKPICY